MYQLSSSSVMSLVWAAMKVIGAPDVSIRWTVGSRIPSGRLLRICETRVADVVHSTIYRRSDLQLDDRLAVAFADRAIDLVDAVDAANAASTCCVTCFSISAGAAPGWLTPTSTTGKSMSGFWVIVICIKAMIPASVSPMNSTIGATGLRMHHEEMLRKFMRFRTRRSELPKVKGSAWHGTPVFRNKCHDRHVGGSLLLKNSIAPCPGACLRNVEPEKWIAPTVSLCRRGDRLRLSYLRVSRFSAFSIFQASCSTSALSSCSSLSGSELSSGFCAASARPGAKLRSGPTVESEARTGSHNIRRCSKRFRLDFAGMGKLDHETSPQRASGSKSRSTLRSATGRGSSPARRSLDFEVQRPATVRRRS